MPGPMIKVKTAVVDRDLGWSDLKGELGEMGVITIGVQGDEAAEKHQNSDLTVGELAAAHELGLVPGAPMRSWLRSFLDANQDRIQREIKEQFAAVIQRRVNRNKALINLGYKWVGEMRKFIANGHVRPRNAPSTEQKKGANTPLFETADIANAITYKVFLPKKRSIRDREQRSVVFGSKRK